MYFSVCYKDYKAKLNNIDIKYGEYFKTYHKEVHYSSDIEEIHIYREDYDEVIIPSTVFSNYFMSFENYYSLLFEEKTEKSKSFLGFNIKPKFKSTKIVYEAFFRKCLFDEIYLLNTNIFCYLKLIEEMDGTLLYPYKNIIIANLDNLQKLYEADNTELFKKAIENSGKVFKDMYDTCKSIYKEVEEINLNEQKNKEQELFKKNEEITSLSQSFFKDLNRLSNKSR